MLDIHPDPESPVRYYCVDSHGKKVATVHAGEGLRPVCHMFVPLDHEEMTQIARFMQSLGA